MLQMSRDNSDMRDVLIYLLRDPLTGECRYVGKTVKRLETRLQNHIAQAKYYKRRHVCHWISKLIGAGHKPGIELIETVPSGQDWQSRESFWIGRYRAQGCALTNLTDGGEGWHGLRHSEEWKREMSARLKGRSLGPEWKKRIGDKARGRPCTESAKLKLSAAFTGRIVSDETRRRMSAARRGKGSMPGENNPRAKLNASDVAVIRGSDATHSSLGRRYGVSATTIANIRCRKLWRHVL